MDVNRVTIHNVLEFFVVHLQNVFITFSLTKNKSSSICLVLECSTGLWARATVLILSQKTMGVVCLTCNSDSKV